MSQVRHRLIAKPWPGRPWRPRGSLRVRGWILLRGSAITISLSKYRIKNNEGVAKNFCHSFIFNPHVINYPSAWRYKVSNGQTSLQKTPLFQEKEMHKGLSSRKAWSTSYKTWKRQNVEVQASVARNPSHLANFALSLENSVPIVNRQACWSND